MITRFAVLKVVLLLMIALTFQNCKIYESQSVSVQDAIHSGKRVKVYTPEMEDYVFEALKMEDGQLVGVTKRKSKTAKKLLSSELRENSDEKFVNVALSKDQIGEVYEQNETASGTLNLAIIITAGLTAFYFLFFAVN